MVCEEITEYFDLGFTLKIFSKAVPLAGINPATFQKKF